MTRKIYRSAMGKTVDLGALLLQNEQVRAVGNMGVNAAGDLVDSSNRVIDQRNKQVQKQYKKQTNVSANTPVATSTLSAKKSHTKSNDQSDDIFEPLDEKVSVTENQTADTKLDKNNTISTPATGGLAAAIARDREVKQTLEKTLRQRQQEQGIRKI